MITIEETGKIKEALAPLGTSALRYVIQIGIGGMGLGARAVYDALHGHFDLLEPARYPKIIFLDTVNPAFRDRLANLLKLVKPEEVAVVMASESGKTLETLSNLEWIKQFVDQSRIVEITKRGYFGRFSIFTAANLSSLYLAGVDIDELIAGAKEVGAAPIPEINNSIREMFFFHPELESLGKWWRQLVAESLGKEGKGITPVVAIGSNDLHSQMQLDLDGPKDKFVTFVHGPLAPEMQAIYTAAKNAYAKAGVPTSEIILSDLSLRSLGRFMHERMLETVALAQKLGVDPFNQPAVEGYKEEARKILGAH